MNMSVKEALSIWIPVIELGVQDIPECREALRMSKDALIKMDKITRILNEAPVAIKITKEKSDDSRN